jgi:hypothetical protein
MFEYYMQDWLTKAKWFNHCLDCHFQAVNRQVHIGMRSAANVNPNTSANLEWGKTQRLTTGTKMCIYSALPDDYAWEWILLWMVDSLCKQLTQALSVVLKPVGLQNSMEARWSNGRRLLELDTQWLYYTPHCLLRNGTVAQTMRDSRTKVCLILFLAQ